MRQPELLGDAALFYYTKYIVKLIYMDKTLLKEYFQFTRTERTSILLLLVLIAITGAIPAFLNNGANEPLPSLDSYEASIKQLEELTDRSIRDKEEGREDYADLREPSHNATANSLFMFDPNTLKDADWKKLGVRDKTITTIRKYLAKGGRFRRPEDISKIYGLSEKDIKRLLPFVRISVELPKTNGIEAPEQDIDINSLSPKPGYSLPIVVEINEADTSLFIQLPGIGSKLANRIINFRDKLGGFYSVDQVGETFGLADSVFQKLKSQMVCRKVTTKKININSASAADLSKHPYINWKLANAIVQYRTQHGNFKTLEEIRQIQLLDQNQLAKLLPYLSVE